MEECSMGRKAEAIGSAGGAIAGVAAGAKIGAGIGIAVGGPIGAFAGTIPCAIVGGVIVMEVTFPTSKIIIQRIHLLCYCLSPMLSTHL